MQSSGSRWAIAERTPCCTARPNMYNVAMNPATPRLMYIPSTELWGKYCQSSKRADVGHRLDDRERASEPRAENEVRAHRKPQVVVLQVAVEVGGLLSGR